MDTNGQTPLELRISRAERRLNHRRRRLVQAILENARETCFLSSRELAKRHRVDPATIVRTVQALGYGRFSDFAADLRGHFLRSLTPYEVMQAAASQALDPRDRIRQTLQEDLERLRRCNPVSAPIRSSRWRVKSIAPGGSSSSASTLRPLCPGFWPTASPPLGFTRRRRLAVRATSSITCAF